MTTTETGCCGTAPTSRREELAEVETMQTACCGGPAPADTDACCNDDALAKGAGASDCGCA